MVSLKVWNGSALKDPDMIIAKGSTDTLFEVNYVVVNNSSQNPVTVWQAISQTTRSTTTPLTQANQQQLRLIPATQRQLHFRQVIPQQLLFIKVYDDYKHLVNNDTLIPLGQRLRRLIRQGLQAEPQAGLTRRIMFKPMRRICWSPSSLSSFWNSSYISIGQAGMALVERHISGATHIR